MDDLDDLIGLGPRIDADIVTVRSLRLDRGWTQLDLAYETGLTPQTISRIESGYQAPTLRTCYLLAAALDVPIWRITGSVLVTRSTRRDTPAARRFRNRGRNV